MIKLKRKVKDFINDERGMGVIEVVLIIVVLVGLALIFKTQITGIANGLYESIKEEIKAF